MDFVVLSVLLCAPSARRGLHSVPTRRSSDLAIPPAARNALAGGLTVVRGMHDTADRRADRMVRPQSKRRGAQCPRSEEHTSELQSLAYLVCRLLLEKKTSPKSVRFARPTARC